MTEKSLTKDDRKALKASDMIGARIIERRGADLLIRATCASDGIRLEGWWHEGQSVSDIMWGFPTPPGSARRTWSGRRQRG